MISLEDYWTANLLIMNWCRQRAVIDTIPIVIVNDYVLYKKIIMIIIYLLRIICIIHKTWKDYRIKGYCRTDDVINGNLYLHIRWSQCILCFGNLYLTFATLSFKTKCLQQNLNNRNSIGPGHFQDG